MASDIVTINDSYFNMKRFEEKLAYAPFSAEKRIIRRKKIRLFDWFLSFLVIATFIIMITFAALTAFHFAGTIVKDAKIAKLTEELNNRNNEIENVKSLLKVDENSDNLKRIAFLELNMITPTDKNIIYFEKSETQ